MLISLITKAQSDLRIKKNEDQKKSSMRNDLGNNIISFSPFGIGLTAANQQSPDVTIALSYEHISKNGYIGIKIPVMASLYNPYFYALPTIKLYPGKQGVAKYAIGPQLLLASGTVKVLENNTPYANDEKLISKQRKQFGFMLNNSFNFTIAKHVYVGLDLSLGVIYYDNAPNAIVNANQDFYSGSKNSSNSISPCTHIGFNMGYRF